MMAEWFSNPERSGIFQAGTTLILENRDYKNSDRRDGYYTELDGTVIHNCHGTIHRLWSGLSLFHNHTEADIYQYSGTALKAGFIAGLPLECTLNGRIRYSFSNYDEKELLAPKKRRDRQFQFNLGISRMLTETVGVELNWQETDNNSTFDLYEYKRRIITLTGFMQF
jgi:hypothetical protein